MAVKRQLSMVLDLNKCIGCQTCTAACKLMWTNRNGREFMYWNNVETQPGKGYPRDYQNMGGGFDENGGLRLGRQPSQEDYGIPWEYNYEEALMTGTDPWLRPNVKPTWGANWDEDEGLGEYPNSYYFYLPRLCNHCANPACLAACTRNAIYKRQEDGIVLVDQERCRGYRYCVNACPYKKIYFNEQISKSEKCIFCYPRIEKGLPTACAQQCVGRIRWIGYRDDEEGPIHLLVEKYKVALPLHPEWGTQPNVFYVPPLSPPKYGPDGQALDESRIPLEYLESLFGNRVGEVMATLQTERQAKAEGRDSELMDTLIGYKHAEMFKLS
ncbi:dimethylsulfide dehydrogenase subunit beta/complex iron-sulfur molybdoenzyme family reductase subunit beta [Marinobacterium halophilum]|uniref:Dimethylsulfide dehydrogenase subunit beta/complex iron-sulfur molybdoenzyme family reductase subunit beta n=1 Tax=Marinobacterium halophilum TaxID=267374 RepID=A0A2P8F3F8_9GAMM|nr:4Fe-4S dicluster domain-containing protein [Marinobacterium halophilum]PSL16251.1 dimethylsulfide dehydrogenase subunit beta/complex iron-sulfur molybdoenzyme family reductase subunit beta [Marinobacterium halophilum]